jgi:hypothetical protein
MSKLVYTFSSSTTFLWQLIKSQILLRIKSTNVITRKVNTGNYSNQNNWSPVPTLNLTPLYCQTQLPPQVFRHKSRKTNLNSPVSTAHIYLLTAVYWSVIMECQTEGALYMQYCADLTINLEASRESSNWNTQSIVM